MERMQTLESKSGIPAQGTIVKRNLMLLAVGLCLLFGSVLFGACGVISASVSTVALVTELESIVLDTGESNAEVVEKEPDPEGVEKYALKKRDIQEIRLHQYPSSPLTR